MDGIEDYGGVLFVSYCMYIEYDLGRIFSI